MSARTALLTALAATVSAAGAQTPATADDIARRVSAAPDGSVQMTFASRPGTCGDGRSMIRSGGVMTVYPSVVSRGGWSDSPCDAGPLRVVLGVSDRKVATVRTHVGTRRATQPPSPVTDLGAVPAAAAVRYLLSLSSSLEGRASRDALYAVALADSVVVWRDLVAAARDTSRPRETRRAALMYIGMTDGNAEAVGALDGIARDENADRSLREAALVALSDFPEGAGAPPLIRLARGAADGWLRKKATFWLGNTDDGRARQTLRDLAAADTVAEDVRGDAIFALGHLGERSAEDAKFLQTLFPRLTSSQLRDKVIQSMGQTEDEAGKRWLLTVVRDRAQPVGVRKQALFWAGQNQWLPVAELTAIYPTIEERDLKEHFVFVLSQRRESDAIDKLMDIAKSDPDKAMRSKAMFWLGQSRDPRVARFLQEMIER